MFFQGLQQFSQEAVVDVEFSDILRTVDACQIEDKITFFAIAIQQLFFRIDIISKNLIDFDISCTIFMISDIFQIGDKVSADKTPRTGY